PRWHARPAIPPSPPQGPGGDTITTMPSGGGSDRLFPETLQPNATYVVQDLTQPSLTHGSFTALSSGAAAPVNVTYGGGKAKSEQQSSLVGSLALRGTLQATVSAKGALKLTSGGKVVSTL